MNNTALVVTFDQKERKYALAALKRYMKNNMYYLSVNDLIIGEYLIDQLKKS